MQVGVGGGLGGAAEGGGRVGAFCGWLVSCQDKKHN